MEEIMFSGDIFEPDQGSTGPYNPVDTTPIFAAGYSETPIIDITEKLWLPGLGDQPMFSGGFDCKGSFDTGSEDYEVKCWGT